MDEAGQPIRDEHNNLILVAKNDPAGVLVSVQETKEVLLAFGLIPDEECGSCPSPPCRSPSPTPSASAANSNSNDCPAQWKDDDAVKYLIHLRHVGLKSLFASQALSNQKKWEKLAKALKEQKENKYWNFSWKQCEAKYKDLKKQYNKVKDQLGTRCSGEPPSKRFRFFDDLDEVCQNSPTVRPVATVSSMAAPSSPSTSGTSSAPSTSGTSSGSERSTSPEVKDPNKILKSSNGQKEKKSRMEVEVKALRDLISVQNESQEEARERRHQEFLRVYSDTMNRLIDKL